MPLFQPFATDTTLTRVRLNALFSKYEAMREEASATVKGCKVRILSNWKGDKKRSQRGKVYTARAAFFQDGWGMCLWLEEARTSIFMYEVEFLDEVAPSDGTEERTRFDVLNEDWE